MILKKIQFIYLFIFYIISNIAFANFENSIVVKVDNEIITNFEIKNKILSNLLLSGREINQKNINDLKNQSLEELIQTKVKIIELSKYNLSIDRLQINQYLKSISKDNIQNLKNEFATGSNRQLLLECQCPANPSTQNGSESVYSLLKWGAIAFLICSRVRNMQTFHEPSRAKLGPKPL